MFEADRLEFVREDNQISVQISSSGYRREQLELIQEYCPVEIVQKDGVLSCLLYTSVLFMILTISLYESLKKRL